MTGSHFLSKSKKSHVLWNPKISYRIQKILYFVHILSQTIHSAPSHSILLTSSEIQSTHLRLELPRCLFHWYPRQNSVGLYFFLLFRVTCLPFPYFLMLPPDRHLANIINEEAPHCVVPFCFSPRPSKVQISSSASCSQNSLSPVLLFM